MTFVDRIRRAALWLCCAAALALPASHHAQADEGPFPSRPLRLIVPYAPGGGTDVIARLFSEHLARRLGQAVVVMNRPGAGTNIGGQALVGAEPNGYTLMAGTNQMIINSVFGPKPPFDPVNGLAPVGLVAEVPYALAVKGDSTVQRAKDLLAEGRPRELTISHAQFEVQLKLLSQAMNVPVLGVPYQGGAQAVTAVLGGDVPLVFAGMSAVSAMAKAGQLRLIGVSAARRTQGFPDVPTLAEQGFPEFVTTAWVSLLAPKGTPDAVLRRLSEETLAITKDPAFADRVRAMGAEPLEAGAADAAARMSAEQALWSRVAR